MFKGLSQRLIPFGASLGRSSLNRKGYGGGKTNMDEQDRQDGNYLVLVREFSSTRRVTQNSPTIVDRKET